jgi:hypothetical protein
MIDYGMLHELDPKGYVEEPIGRSAWRQGILTDRQGNDFQPIRRTRIIPRRHHGVPFDHLMMWGS